MEKLYFLILLLISIGCSPLKPKVDLCAPNNTIKKINSAQAESPYYSSVLSYKTVNGVEEYDKADALNLANVYNSFKHKPYIVKVGDSDYLIGASENKYELIGSSCNVVVFRSFHDDILSKIQVSIETAEKIKHTETLYNGNEIVNTTHFVSWLDSEQMSLQDVSHKLLSHLVALAFSSEPSTNIAEELISTLENSKLSASTPLPHFVTIELNTLTQILHEISSFEKMLPPQQINKSI